MAEETPDKRTVLRNKILSGRKAKTIMVEAFDTEIEVRQPSLGDILDLQELPDSKGRVVGSLINYCYVPGTKERIFDPTDTNVLLGLPFGEDFTIIQEAIAKLTGIDLDDVEKEKGNLENAPATITS